MKRIITCLTSLFSLFFLVAQVYGQGWERTYGGSGSQEGYDVQQTIDSGYILIGHNQNRIYVIKTDQKGDTIWSKKYETGSYAVGKSVIEISDGYMLLSERVVPPNVNSNIYLSKINRYGDTIWTKTYGNSGGMYAASFKQTKDSGFIIVGSSFGDIYVIKTDNNGDTLWTKTFDGILHLQDLGRDVIESVDGGYALLCQGNYQSNNYWADIFLYKLDNNGDTLWTKTYVKSWHENGFSIKQTSDSGYVIVGNSDDTSRVDIYLIKTDKYGDTIWTRTYGGIGQDYGYSIQITKEGDYLLVGTIYYNSGAYLINVDKNGDKKWEKLYRGKGSAEGRSIHETFDGGYIIIGRTYAGGDNDIYLIKTDSLGNTITNIISGNINNENINSNCIIDNGEQGLNNWVVKILPNEKYATADSNGFYSTLVDSGTYTISQITTHPYWTQTCPFGNSYTVNFLTNSYDTSSSNNFGNQISIYCPLMWVDVATNIVRPCRQGTYTVNYCNNGTADANNAYIDVEFPNKIIPLSSSPVNWNSVNGNIYRFDLGTVVVGQCGTIYITDSVLCSAVMGSTLCVKANIFPDTICTPVDTNWDKSSIKVEGYCLNDSLAHFIIYNVGNNMAANSEYRIYINNYFFKKQNFQLNSGDSLVIDVVACGKTIRLEADQRPGHPGNSHPRTTVENCGTGCALPSFGFVNAVASDDEDYFIEEDCQVVRGSYDPNGKLVKPSGITANRYISAKDELEYQINFQNTGNDTAFLIVVRDTLKDNVVDVGSVVSGAGSHPYSFRIYGEGILEWTFKNINLPDSNVNEPASHGFVKFKVKQKSNNPKGTVIKNHAAIYFDFNVPVVTADAIVMVYDTTILSGIKEQVIGNGNKRFEIIVSPNPFREQTTLQITNTPELRITNLELSIYNLLGEKVKQSSIINNQSTISKDNLPDGIYFYQLKSKNETIATGKLVINN